MKLPIFFQKSQFSFQISGLPGLGKKLYFTNSLLDCEVNKTELSISFRVSGEAEQRELKNWMHSIEEKIESYVDEIQVSDSKVTFIYQNRSNLDKLIDFLLQRNGGIANVSAIPTSYKWNPDHSPIIKPCSEVEQRFYFHTTEGRWFLTFTPVDTKHSLEPKYPEDVVKMKNICKRLKVEMHPVTYLPNQFELSRDDWEKLVEYLLA